MKLLSQLWSAIQGVLLPCLQEELGPLTDKQKQVVQTLELVRLEEFISPPGFTRGRPRKNRAALARAFVVKAIYNHGTTRQLLDLLQSSPALRRLCGWEGRRALPHESTFSRAFEEFALTRLPERVHEALIRTHQGAELKGHISRDSTAIEGHETPSPAKREKIKQEKPKRKRGRPKKGEEKPAAPTRLQRQRTQTLEEMLGELDRECDWGHKNNSAGRPYVWKGFKLHLDCVDGQIPVAALLTSASLHDSQAAIPLMEMSAGRVTALYELMDAAYDAGEIHEHGRSLGHVPIIDPNPRRGEKKEMDPPRRERYKERTSIERVFGRLKEEFGAEQVRVRGPMKVMAHLMFGVLALTADQLLRLVKPPLGQE